MQKDLTKKAIVVIDDDEDVREVISFALENDGFTVFPFENGRLGLNGLKTMEKNLPGLIIVDYMMPEMDGISFITEVKKEFPDTLALIPIAISSAMGSLDPKINALKDLILLHKPMDLDDLLKVARKHCS